MFLDTVIVEFDKSLRAVFASAPTRRPIPGAQEAESEMSPAERKRAAALMRVNHSGEICAQALYQGQAITSDNPEVRQALEHAAWEEIEHLAWTERRIAELGGRKSFLNPLWYVGSLVLGGLAGKAGNAWNLGFLAETERQVEAHLTSHLQRLPPKDIKSRAVLEQMRLDEICHAQTAIRLGGRALPVPAPQVMSLISKIMTKTAYYL